MLLFLVPACSDDDYNENDNNDEERVLLLMVAPVPQNKEIVSTVNINNYNS